MNKTEIKIDKRKIIFLTDIDMATSMSSKTENTNLNTSFHLSPMQNSRHRNKRKNRRIIQNIRRLSTIDEIDLHSTSSSNSSGPKKNVVFRRTDIGNVLGEILHLLINSFLNFELVLHIFTTMALKFDV